MEVVQTTPLERILVDAPMPQVVEISGLVQIVHWEQITERIVEQIVVDVPSDSGSKRGSRAGHLLEHVQPRTVQFDEDLMLQVVMEQIVDVLTPQVV